MVDRSIVASVWNEVAGLAVNGGRVIVSFPMIAGRLGIGQGDVDAAIDELAEQRLVTAWHDGKAPCATLTRSAADALGLEMRAYRRRDSVWARPGRRRRGEFPTRNDRIKLATDVEAGGEFDVLGEAKDRDAPPDSIAARAEHVELTTPPSTTRRLCDRNLDPGRLPYPAIFLGMRSQWSSVPTEEPCPGCGGAQLPAASYCVQCDAWGLDWLLSRIKAQEKRDAKARAKANPPRRFIPNVGA